MKKITPLLTASLFFICFSIASSAQQEKIDTAVLSRIRTEALQHSQVMNIAHYLTDVSGPRLTNSPGYERASHWAVNTLQSWGLSNARLEPWGKFGRGWSMENCTVAMRAPYYLPIIAYPLAWTKGTNGPVKADVVVISALQVDSIKKYGNTLKGKIVLPLQTDSVLRSAFTAYAERFEDSTLQKMGDTYMFTAEQLAGMMGVIKNWTESIRLLQQLGCIAVLHGTSFDRDGTVSVSAWFNGKKGAWPDMPTLNLAGEHFFLLQRLLKSKIPVQLELNIQTTYYDKDENGYNVIAEIPGTDPVLKDEVVMIGGHLDSWFSGTGATDNAAGCAVMMEVIRIMKALHIQPKRTIRIALWSGEEQGLLGSHGYVVKHFADPTTMQLLPEHSKISAYYNLDNGTGRIRGIFTQGNKSVEPVFKKWLEPFADLGATTVTLANTGGTDHFTFDAVGIPGFQFIQDPIEYETRTHHTNMDTYDHLIPDDLKQASAIIASFVYHTAMRDEKLPRKPLPKPGPWLFDLF
jgi:hypothetical protein